MIFIPLVTPASKLLKKIIKESKQTIQLAVQKIFNVENLDPTVAQLAIKQDMLVLFWNAIKYFGSEKDLSLLCDSDYFRCYKLQNKSVNMYICGLKPDGDYFCIIVDDKIASKVFRDKFSKDLKKVFLADKYIMEVTLNYMDDIYHDEIQEMAKKLTSGNYEGLEQYGLTQEMINDKESLNEKIRIMEDYLKNNGGN